jgi:hypothetical protein
LSRQENLQKLRDKLKHTNMGGGRQGFWSPPEGRSVIRILPPIGDMEFFFQTVGRHNFPPDGKKNCYCPAFTSEDKLECPVCELVNELYKGDKASKQMAKELGMKRSYWMNVIIRGDKGGEDEGPFIYTPGVQVFGAIAQLVNDPDYGDVYDVESGLDLILNREGTDINTKYTVNPRRNSTPLSDADDVAQGWLDNAKDLAFVELTADPDEDHDIQEGKNVWVLPYDRLVEEMGLSDGFEVPDEVAAEDEDVEEDESPKNKKKAVSATTKPVARKAQPEDDDQEEVAPAKREVANRLARRSIRR